MMMVGVDCFAVLAMTGGNVSLENTKSFMELPFVWSGAVLRVRHRDNKRSAVGGDP